MLSPLGDHTKGTRERMRIYKELRLLQLILTFHSLSAISISHQSPSSFCSKAGTHIPSFLQNLSEESYPLNRMILCKSQKPFLRTSLGLFPVSSINYTSKLITISHYSSCSSSNHFVPPSLLSAGFPTPQPNSLLLFNCSSRVNPIPPFLHNCSRTHKCGAATSSTSCLYVDDAGKLHSGFDPKALNCSHYSRVFRTSLDSNDGEKFGLGTRVSLEISGHAPDFCTECRNASGNCGVVMRCFCHAKECSDKVFSSGGSVDPFGNILCSLLSFTVVLAGFMDYSVGILRS